MDDADLRDMGITRDEYDNARQELIEKALTHPENIVDAIARREDAELIKLGEVLNSLGALPESLVHTWVMEYVEPTEQDICDEVMNERFNSKP